MIEQTHLLPEQDNPREFSHSDEFEHDWPKEFFEKETLSKINKFELPFFFTKEAMVKSY